MWKTILALLLAGGLATATGLAQSGAPVNKHCEPGQGPLSAPPQSAGCIRTTCTNNGCQLGQEINMQPGDCVDTWPTPCRYQAGPEDYYHKFDCVPDYDGCEGPDFKCKWQIDAGSGFLTKLLTCTN